MVRANLFLDTNIWLRYFIGDNEDQLNLVEEILQLNEQGVASLATSSFVLSEFVYVESSFYKISKSDLIEDLESIVGIKNLFFIEKTNFLAGLELYKKSPLKTVKWSDCMIATQIPTNYKLCSFDGRLEKLIGRDRFIHPAQV